MSQDGHLQELRESDETSKDDFYTDDDVLPYWECPWPSAHPFEQDRTGQRRVKRMMDPSLRIRPKSKCGDNEEAENILVKLKQQQFARGKQDVMLNLEGILNRVSTTLEGMGMSSDMPTTQIEIDDILRSASSKFPRDYDVKTKAKQMDYQNNIITSIRHLMASLAERHSLLQQVRNWLDSINLTRGIPSCDSLEDIGEENEKIHEDVSDAIEYTTTLTHRIKELGDRLLLGEAGCGHKEESHGGKKIHHGKPKTHLRHILEETSIMMDYRNFEGACHEVQDILEKSIKLVRTNVGKAHLRTTSQQFRIIAKVCDRKEKLLKQKQDELYKQQHKVDVLNEAAKSLRQQHLGDVSRIENLVGAEHELIEQLDSVYLDKEQIRHQGKQELERVTNVLLVETCSAATMTDQGKFKIASPTNNRGSRENSATNGGSSCEPIKSGSRCSSSAQSPIKEPSPSEGEPGFVTMPDSIDSIISGLHQEEDSMDTSCYSDPNDNTSDTATPSQQHEPVVPAEVEPIPGMGVFIRHRRNPGSALGADIRRRSDQGSALGVDFSRRSDQISALGVDFSRRSDQGSTDDVDISRRSDQGSALGVDSNRRSDQGSALGVDFSRRSDQISALGVDFSRRSDQGSTDDVDISRRSDQGSALGVDSSRRSDQGSALGVHISRRSDQGSALGVHISRRSDQGSAIGVHISRRSDQSSALGVDSSRRSDQGSALGVHISRRSDHGSSDGVRVSRGDNQDSDERDYASNRTKRGSIDGGGNRRKSNRDSVVSDVLREQIRNLEKHRVGRNNEDEDGETEEEIRWINPLQSSMDLEVDQTATTLAGRHPPPGSPITTQDGGIHMREAMLEADVTNLKEVSDIKTELLNFQQTKIAELTAELEAVQTMMMMSNGESALQVHGEQSASTLHHVKDYMSRLRCDYDKQLVRLQRAVLRERQMGDKQVHKAEVRHRGQLRAMDAHAIHLAYAVNRFKDAIVQLLRKEGMPIGAEALQRLGRVVIIPQRVPGSKHILTSMAIDTSEVLTAIEGRLSTSLAQRRIDHKNTEYMKNHTLHDLESKVNAASRAKEEAMQLLQKLQSMRANTGRFGISRANPENWSTIHRDYKELQGDYKDTQRVIESILVEFNASLSTVPAGGDMRVDGRRVSHGPSGPPHATLPRINSLDRDRTTLVARRSTDQSSMSGRYLQNSQMHFDVRKGLWPVVESSESVVMPKHGHISLRQQCAYNLQQLEGSRRKSLLTPNMFMMTKTVVKHAMQLPMLRIRNFFKKYTVYRSLLDARDMMIIRQRETTNITETDRILIIIDRLELHMDQVSGLFMERTRRLQETQALFLQRMESLLADVVNLTGLPLLLKDACSGSFSQSHLAPVEVPGSTAPCSHLSMSSPGQSSHIRWGNVDPVIGNASKIYRVNPGPTWSQENAMVHGGATGFGGSMLGSINTPHMLEYDINRSQRLAQRIFNRLHIRSKYPLGSASIYDLCDLTAKTAKQSSHAAPSHASMPSNASNLMTRLSHNSTQLPSKLSLNSTQLPSKLIGR